MYDELVKRLRETSCGAEETLWWQAADAIEELSHDYEKLAEDFNGAMELLHKREKPRWILVTERLPLYGDWVLGIGPKRGYHVCEYRGITHFPYSGDSPRFSAKGRTLTVTHWMPLPEPPEGE